MRHSLPVPLGERSYVAVALACLVLTGCGSSSKRSSSTPTTAVAPSTTAPAPVTTVAPTTAAPPTTATRTSKAVPAPTTAAVPPAGYMTAEEIAAKLVPLGCSAEPPAPDSTNIDVGAIKPKNELDCTIISEDVEIDEYLNAQQVAYNSNLAKGVGCSLAKQFGLKDLPYVVGYNWTVSPSTTATAQQIKTAIGGHSAVVTIHC